MKLTIIGAGEIGQALALLVRKNGQEVCFWDVDSKKCSAPTLVEVLKGVDAVLFAVPSFVLAESMKDVDKLLAKQVVFFVITKGLNPKTGETPAEIMAEFRRPVAFLGGPLLAEEIVSGAGGFMAVAGSREAGRLAEKFFEWGNLRVHQEADLFGAAAAGMLKNFYAFLIGAAAGAGWGENLQSEIFTAATRELVKILPRFGGQSQTAWSAAGMGDLHATAFSKHSRNRTAGENFIKTGQLDIQAESVRTWPILRKRLGEMESWPLLKLTGLIMEGRARPEEIKKIIDEN